MRSHLQTLCFILNTLGCVFFFSKIDMTDFITSFSLIKLDSKYYEIRPSLKGQWFATIEPIQGKL